MLGAVGEQHHQPVDADAAAAGRRHAVFERADEVGVVVHRLLVAGVLRSSTCARKRAAWSSAIVQLGEAVGDLAAGDEQLEALGDAFAVVSEARASGDTSTG